MPDHMSHDWLALVSVTVFCGIFLLPGCCMQILGTCDKLWKNGVEGYNNSTCI
jgi:hypothetical protein